MTTTRRYVRPARPVRGPKAPAVTELRLEPPTELPRPVPPSKLKLIMPVIMVAAMIGMMAMMFSSGRAMNPMMMMFPVMMMVSMFGMLSGQMGGGGGANSTSAGLNEERKDYLRSLSNNRKTVHKAEEELHKYLQYTHPGPSGIARLVGGKRMWEVQVASPQFLRIRVGRGRIANQVRVIVPEAAPTSELDPVGVVELTKFAKAYSTVGGMPVAINLLSAPQVGFDGDPDAVAGLLRAMIAEVVTLHGPDQVAIAAVLSTPEAPEWAWLKWLPHTQHPGDTDAIGSGRMVYSTVAELRNKVLAGLNRGPFSANSEPSMDRTHYILIVDSAIHTTERDISGIDGCTWLRLGTAEALPRSLKFHLDAEHILTEVTSRGKRRVGVADAMSIPAITTLARKISPFRLSTVVEAVAAEQASGGTSWEDMVGLDDPGHIRTDRAWKARRDADRARLSIPFGYDPAGSLVYLDIKESAEEGMGPHGMCIGATGSGKSEFLRTLVLSAVAEHSPDVLNLLLVDFKGGATFLGFDRLSHVTAVVTNMEEEADLVTRMEDVINGEMSRRQRVLRDAGNFASVADYERAREQGADLPPMPTLLIILDEFAELLEQHPSFSKLFVAIGRLGRSLRIHLLLSSQKVPASRMGELEAHLSYRIALRTNQTSDSRDAIGTADAYHLPKKPGSGYLRVGAGDLQRFQAAYVGSAYVPPVHTAATGPQRSRRPTGGYRPPQRFITAFIPDVQPVQPAEPTPAAQPELTDDGEAVTVMETVLQQLAQQGTPAHKMWLPPLGVPPTLDRLTPAVSNGALQVPVAIVDKPRQQRQDVWTVDLSGGGGHVAVVGGPQSGKSTALQTLVMSAALTHTPEQVQFYCLDFSGGLSSLRQLPHVGSVASSRDTDRIRRTFALINNLLASRETLFSELGIDSMREFRRRRNDPRLSAELTARGDHYGDVFIVVDGWDIGFAISGPYYDEYHSAMENLALQGLNYGVHLVIGSSRWAAIRPAIKDMLQTRIEMRLGDLSDTAFTKHRTIVAAVPADRPGRCISTDGLHMLTALPRIDGDGNAESVSAGLSRAGEQLTRTYGPIQAPEVRLLPARISIAEVLASENQPTTLAERLRVPFGIRESDLGLAAVDLGVSSHFIVLGSTGCGKSTVLAALLESIRTRFTRDQARVLLVDYRRQHMDALPQDRLVGYLTNERDVQAGIPELVEAIQQRRAPEGVTSQQLKDRSWWSGPEIFVVVDDYHMVAQRGALNPLEPIKELIVDSRDTGLHVIVARSIAQADMALYDNVLGQIKNVNSSGLIMDGTKHDGVLLGDVKASKQPVGRGTLVEPMTSHKDLVQAAGG